MMDGRKMDVERGRVVHREKRARKLAVVVAVQNMLVAACLLVTLYVYWDVQKQKQKQHAEDDVHIKFAGISDTMGNATLHFDLTSSSKKMSKVDDKIYVNCTGPYILYMDVCYRSLYKETITGILQLKVGTTAVTSFNLTTSNEDCRVLHGIVYLRVKEQASLHIYAKDSFKIKHATLGLNYLLGTRCEY